MTRAEAPIPRSIRKWNLTEQGEREGADPLATAVGATLAMRGATKKARDYAERWLAHRNHMAKVVADYETHKSVQISHNDDEIRKGMEN